MVDLGFADMTQAKYLGRMHTPYGIMAVVEANGHDLLVEIHPSRIKNQQPSEPKSSGPQPGEGWPPTRGRG